MAAIFQLRRGTSNVTLADGELYLHKGIGSIQFSSGSSNPITLLPLNVPVSGNINLIGNISTSGDVRIGGNIYLGDNLANDSVNINSPFSGSIIPSGSNIFDLGSSTSVYRNVYANSISASSFTGSFSGSIGGIDFNVFSTSVDSRLDQLETDSGSQNTRITGLESKASTLQTYTASVNSRLNNLEGDSGSYATTGSNNFIGNQNITGSFIVSGSNVEFTRDWPEVGSESHFLRVAPFTSSTGRYYDGIGIGVEHWEDETGTYEHSLQIHSWDNHIAPNYGAELNVGPYRTHMRVYPSGSNGNLTNISVQELSNGKTQALIYGDLVQVGAFIGQEILIGNTGSLVTISGSNMLLDSPLTSSHPIVATLFSGSISGIGNVTQFSSSISQKFETIGNVTGSFDNRLDRLEESTQSLNDYTQSLKTAIDVTGGDTRILGNLIVDGTQTSLNTTQLLIEDKVITLASGSTNSGAADGAGFEIAGANVSMSWQNANNRLAFNTNLSSVGSISASTFVGLNGVSLTTYSTSVDSRLTNSEITSASILGHISDINVKTGSFENKFTTIQSLTASYDIHTASLNTYTQSVNGHISDLNSWTSSQNQKDTIISNISASYNGFTGSATASIVELFSTASNHEVRIDDLESKATTLQTYTASVDSRLSNLESDSGSQNTRITNLESKATTLQTYTASIDSKFIIIESVTASYNSVTASLNQFTSSTYSNFSTSVDLRLDQLEYTTSILTPEGQAEAFNAINNFTGSANNRLNNLELTSASLNLFSSSLNTTFATDSELSAVSTSISTSIQSLSQSLDNRLDQLEIFSGSQQSKDVIVSTYTASMNIFTASVNGHISDINSYTSSNDTTNTTQNNRLSRLEESTASLNAFTTSADSRLDVIETTYATTGSNTFVGNQIISGSTYVTGNLVVYGSSSLQNITASAVSIGTNIIYLNTDTPAVRFAGISVFDSGSTGATGSLLWDSQNERWIYQKGSGSLYNGAMLISGPRNTGSLGDEVGMPTNKLIMGMGGDHISSSNIYHNGTDTAFAGNLEVTGSTTLGTANITTLNAGNGVISGSTQLSGKVIPNLSGSFTGSYTGSFTGSFRGPLNGVADYAATVATVTTNTTTDTTLYPIFSETQSPNTYISLRTHASGSFYYNGVTRKVYGETFVGAIEATNGVVSGSSQIDATATTNWSTGIKTQLDSNTVVSGSSQITLSSTTGGGTTANVQFGSLGIGTAASGVSGEIRATGDIVAFYSSDERLKENIQPIQNALSKVESISGNTYDWKEGFETIHSHIGHDLGVIAQEVQSVLPEVVTERETGYLAVDYVKLVPVLIEAIKELSAKVKELESK
jgi:uncharacterized coiled-coil protein SlyX